LVSTGTGVECKSNLNLRLLSAKNELNQSPNFGLGQRWPRHTMREQIAYRLVRVIRLHLVTSSAKGLGEYGASAMELHQDVMRSKRGPELFTGNKIVLTSLAIHLEQINITDSSFREISARIDKGDSLV